MAHDGFIGMGNVATWVPEHRHAQTFVRDELLSVLTDRKARRYAQGVFNRSGIETRYSVLRSFSSDESAVHYRDAAGAGRSPGTAQRNQRYIDEAGPAFVTLARRALAQTPEVGPQDVTHVITVSCTGFFNPGPDLAVVNALGLNPSTQRFNLGFMGCYAAITALKLARQLCQADPQSVVLVLCLELCSLHLQLTENTDDILAAAIFGDGGAGVVVSSQLSESRRLNLEGFASATMPSGASDMAWTLGDHGCNLVLSSYVPEIIGENISEAIAMALAGSRFSIEDISHWAIHPGGKAIIEAVGESLGLEEEALTASTEILRQFGNMSSASVLFVLDGMIRSGILKVGDPIFAVAFGPGLTAEMGVLSAVPSGMKQESASCDSFQV